MFKYKMPQVIIIRRDVSPAKRFLNVVNKRNGNYYGLFSAHMTASVLIILSV
jgi:hypothetical protein